MLDLLGTFNISRNFEAICFFYREEAGVRRTLFCKCQYISRFKKISRKDLGDIYTSAIRSYKVS